MITAFIASYGYLAVFLGTLLEGETVLIAAGFTAHRGLLDLPLVIFVAIAGGTLGDKLAFWLGRYKGKALIDRFPAVAQRKARIHALLEKYDAIFILTLRFLYGLRIAGPLIIGSGQVAALRFFVLNLLGAILWACTICGVGYSLGLAISSFISHLQELEEIVLAAILIAGLLFLLWRHLVRRRRTRQH